MVNNNGTLRCHDIFLFPNNLNGILHKLSAADRMAEILPALEHAMRTGLSIAMMDDSGAVAGAMIMFDLCDLPPSNKNTLPQNMIVFCVTFVTKRNACAARNRV